LSHRDAALDEEATNLVDHGRALTNKARAHAMQRQQIALLRSLDGDEVHGRPLHGLRDRLGVAIVVLVALEERLDVLCWEEANVMPECPDLPGDVMRAAARFQADKATRHIGKPAAPAGCAIPWSAAR
jgi:hypothetical protein